MPRTPAHLRPFDVGPFTIERFIGRGGMASVWGGRHRASAIPIALKVVDAELARAQRYRVAFAHEVRAVARLDHPGVVRVFDHGAVDDAAAAEGGLPRGAPYLVMEHLDGGPLDGAPSAPSWTAIVRVLEVLLDALAHAHARGVIHRDLKPDNVLYGARGPVITDFGLAFRPGRDRADAASSGTPGYMAPEQIRGAWRRFGPPTDLYALGCIAWELACGAAPHLRPGLAPLAVAMAHLNQPLPGFTPRTPLPPRFEGWLRRLLARAPEDRFPMAADALGALRAIIDDRPDRPPTMPADWRLDEQPPRPALLVGVGRALFGHRSWPAVGRERARDQLWRALRRVRAEGRPRALLIEGPSGHGKTHLAEWLAERAHRAGIAQVLRARHEPSGPDGGPAGGFGPMLARHFGVVGDDVRHALPTITALPALRGGSRQRAIEIAALAAPDGICIDGDIEVRLDRAARAELLPDALAALASDRPLVVLVDDAQWGLSSLRIIDRLLGLADGPPVLMILTVRSDAVARGSPAESRLDGLRQSPAVEALTLGPLDPAAHSRVIRAMLPVDEALATAVVERAAGSPLFAAELLRYFIGAGLLEDGPAGYRLAPGAADGLPRGLQAVWQARLVDALGAHAADAWPALELAAALGLMVDGDEWTAACARAGFPWSRPGMERLLDARLMRITEAGEWAFCHAMLRETLAAASRAAGRWGHVNRACADVLTERGAPALRLAEHHLAAGERAAAIEPLTVAASEALVDGEIELLQRLVRQRLGILRGLRVPRRDARWQSLRLHCARIDQRAGHYGRSLRRAQQVERIAAADGDLGLQAKALYVIGNALYYTEGPRKSVRAVAAGLPLARRAGDPTLLTPMLSDYASTLMFLGRMDESEAALLEAWRHLGGQKRPRQEGTVLYYLANVHAFRGEAAPAIARCRQARDAFRMTGSRHPQALTWSVEGDIERRQGALDRAARCYAAFAERVQAVGPAERAYLALNTALLALARGQLRHARRQLDLAAAEDLSTQRAVIAAAHLACAGGLGDWLMWDATAHRLVAILDDAPISPDVPWAAERAADAAEAAGEPIRATFARRVAAEHRQRLSGGESSSVSG